jgi:hypothetical protein
MTDWKAGPTTPVCDRLESRSHNGMTNWEIGAPILSGAVNELPRPRVAI